MKIKKVRIRNFRSIRDAEITFGDTTVLIGPNNAGKTAVLEAVRIALTRRWGQRGTGFTEYDIHLNDTRTDPKVGEPVCVEILIQEESPEEWSDDIQASLADIIVVDASSGCSTVLLRVTCSWDDGEQSYIPRWEFLNADRKALSGKSARAVNLQEFFEFLPVFYLEALRDAGDECSSRSQFWGKLLRTVQIPEQLEKRSKRIFDLLNRRLLDSDPRLANLAGEISTISQVANCDGVGTADLRVLPLNTWDILSKAEVIYRTEVQKPWLPLTRHGQGVQSLSVIFLFKSFVELVLRELFRQDSTPVLALEEPETHLHPQAARSLWTHVQNLKGQKIIATHSPYFLQFVPFKDIRVVRDGPNGSTVAFLPREFRVRVPSVPKLLSVIQKHSSTLAFDAGSSELVAKCAIDQTTYRELIVAFADHKDKIEIHELIKQLHVLANQHIDDDELSQLETFAKRIRGEIFFANRWLLVEGQSEFHLVHSLGKAIGYGLDEHGVAVIDFQNNGNPDSFAALARAFEYPWLIVVDGDGAGNNFLKRVVDRGFSADEMKKRSFQLKTNNLESELVADGLQDVLKAVLIKLGRSDAQALTDAELIVALEGCKGTYAPLLGLEIEADIAVANRMPTALREAVQRLRGLS